MKEDDLVRLMDAYMGCEGYYMKPKIEKDGIGKKEEKELQVFTGTPKVECAVCADVPNLTDIDADNDTPNTIK